MEDASVRMRAGVFGIAPCWGLGVRGLFLIKFPDFSNPFSFLL